MVWFLNGHTSLINLMTYSKTCIGSFCTKCVRAKMRCLCPKDSYAFTLLALCQTRCKHDLQIFYRRAFLYSVHCKLSRSMAECQHPHSCMPQTYIFCKASALICHTRLAANACLHCIIVSHAFIVCRLQFLWGWIRWRWWQQWCCWGQRWCCWGWGWCCWEQVFWSGHMVAIASSSSCHHRALVPIPEKASASRV